MIRGWYTGASGMMAQQTRLDAISNNLANVDTTGYKKDIAVHKAFPQLLLRRLEDDGVYLHPLGSGDYAPVIGKLGTGVENNEIFTEFGQGSLKQTESPFDIALEQGADKDRPACFMCVETPTGERYTRNGTFVLGKEGYLETKDGFRVLGESGPIQVKENNFRIDKQGRIWVNAAYQDGNPNNLVSMAENEWEQTVLLDTLKIVEFDDQRYLAKQGTSLWRATEESGPAHLAERERPGVLQGFLETANVNPVYEMVQMIEVNRAYEANQKTIQAEDAMLGKLINETAKA